MQTLSVDLDGKLPEKSDKAHNSAEVANCQITSPTEQSNNVNGPNALPLHLDKKHSESQNVGLRKRKIAQQVEKNVSLEGDILYRDNSGSDTESMAQRISYPSKLENDGKGTSTGYGNLLKKVQISEVVDDPTLPTEMLEGSDMNSRFCESSEMDGGKRDTGVLEGSVDAIRPPRIEDAGLEDCALPPDLLMEAFSRAASSIKLHAPLSVSSNEVRSCIQNLSLSNDQISEKPEDELA